MSIRAVASETAQAQPTLAEHAIAGVVAAGALVLPLIISRGGADTFRVPKEIAFRGEAILLLVAFVFWAVARVRKWRIDWRQPSYLLAAAILLWTLVTVLTSTNRLLSVDSYVTAVAGAVIFVAATLTAQMPHGILIVDFAVIGACINSVLIMLQETHVWNPLRFPQEITGHHLSSTALIGHPNDVGTYLLTPLLAALVMAVVSRGKRRWIYLLVTVILIGGMAASSTRTAIGAFMVGGIVFILRRSWRAALVIVAAFGLVALIALSPSTTLGNSVRELWKGLRERRYDVVFSMRLPLFLSAADMVRDHPLTGVGPGCYGYHDMPYRMRLANHYPETWIKGWPQNAGQTHNDHLQVAAETGLPGSALLLAAFVLVFRASWKQKTAEPDTSMERRFARALLPPLAAAYFVLMLAQFPLELAAPRLLMLTFTGLCLGWIHGR